MALPFAADALPQFVGEGPDIIVRNTFIDIEDTVKPQFKRSRTVPCPACNIGQESTSDENDCALWSHEDSDSSFEQKICEPSLEMLAVPRVAPLWQTMFAPDVHIDSEDSLSNDEAALPISAGYAANSFWPPAEITCSGERAPQNVTCSYSHGVAHISWQVESRALRSYDKQVVSLCFTVQMGEKLPDLAFKLTLHSSGANFKKSRGQGSVTLKCESECLNASTPAKLYFSVGAGEKEQARRGPIIHSFDNSATCSLPKGEDTWGLNAAVDKKTKTFTIFVEIALLSTAMVSFDCN